MVMSHGRRKPHFIRSTSRSRGRATRPDSTGDEAEARRLTALVKRAKARWIKANRTVTRGSLERKELASVTSFQACEWSASSSSSMPALSSCSAISQMSWRLRRSRVCRLCANTARSSGWFAEMRGQVDTDGPLPDVWLDGERVLRIVGVDELADQRGTRRAWSLAAITSRRAFLLLLLYTLRAVRAAPGRHPPPLRLCSGVEACTRLSGSGTSEIPWSKRLLDPLLRQPGAVAVDPPFGCS